MIKTPGLKSWLLALFFSFSINAGAQPKNIAGAYYQPGTPGDGGGGATFYLKENNHFVIVAFGTLVVGEWRIVQDSMVVLSPKNPDAPFYLYGRKDPKLKSGIRIMVAGDNQSGPYYGKFPEAMQLVFNENYNCGNYPNVKVIPTVGPVISFLENPGDGRDVYNPRPVEKVIYQFETNGYNDFIVQMLSPNLFYPDFVFKIVKYGLQPEHSSEVMEKIKRKLEAEELTFLNKSDEFYENAFRAPYKTANKAYNLFDDLEKRIGLEQYKYDSIKNAYILKGLNPARESDDYQAREVLYKFDRIKSEKKEYSFFKPIAGSLFYSVCENN